MRIINISFLLYFLFAAAFADIYDDVKNSRNFTGKVVLVTGSSSGIGEGTVKLFSSLGANVVVTGRNQTNVKRVAQQSQILSPHGLKPLEVVADLSKEEDVVRLINATIAEFGQIDVLVNNAGSFEISFINDPEILRKFDDTIKIDTRAPLHLIHLSLPFLHKSKGTIINISSIAGLKPLPGGLVYNSAKASLDMLTKVLAVELGSYGIRVNSINPGFIQTVFQFTEEGKKRFESLIPLQRIGQPIDVASAVVFLSSSDAQYITGITLVVDGGILFNYPSNFDFSSVISRG